MAGRKEYIANRIHIHGRVQGVGFRPYIYRLAHQYYLNGWVENRNDGVIIHIEGNPESVETFIRVIREQAPPASAIKEIFLELVPKEDFSDFRIVKSENTSDQVTDISPDIAVCNDCLEDLKVTTASN